jgi:carbonic anhydrase
MSSLEHLIQRNRVWASARRAADPDFFERNAGRHTPSAMYIGCCDARVPADHVTGADVGELFVHRNVANQVVPSDVSLAAGLQYAIEVLGVQDVIVCGHHACGGVRASLGGEAPSYVEAWIGSIRRLARVHAAELEGLGPDEAADRLVELNVHEQIRNLSSHPSVRRAWAEGRSLRLHGWVYQMASGLMRPLAEVDGIDGIRALDDSSGLIARAK